MIKSWTSVKPLDLSIIVAYLPALAVCAVTGLDVFRAAAKWQDEANQVIQLMLSYDNWSSRKAMMRFVGIDCGPCRSPFTPITAAQYAALSRRMAKQGIVKAGQAQAFPGRVK